MVGGTYSKGHALPGANWWKSGREVRGEEGDWKGAGGEGGGSCVLLALQLSSASLMGFCPDASEEVWAEKMPIYSRLMQYSVSKQKGSESLTRSFILSRPSSVLHKNSSFFFFFVHFPVC